VWDASAASLPVGGITRMWNWFTPGPRSLPRESKLLSGNNWPILQKRGVTTPLPARFHAGRGEQAPFDTNGSILGSAKSAGRDLPTGSAVGCTYTTPAYTASGTRRSVNGSRGMTKIQGIGPSDFRLVGCAACPALVSKTAALAACQSRNDKELSKPRYPACARGAACGCGVVRSVGRLGSTWQFCDRDGVSARQPG
jgi:hypothetical protein